MADPSLHISPPAPGPPARIEEPASGGRLLLGWILILVAAVMLVIGWIGVSGEPLVAAQMAYLMSGGIGGMLAGIIGVGLLVSNDIRRDRERLGRVEAAMLEVRGLLSAQAEALQEMAQSGGTNGSAPPERKAASSREAGRT